MPLETLKDQGYESLVEPCRDLWAKRYVFCDFVNYAHFREEQKRLKEKLESLREFRQLMEKQLLIQDTLLYKMQPNGIGFYTCITSILTFC